MFSHTDIPLTLTYLQQCAVSCRTLRLLLSGPMNETLIAYETKPHISFFLSYNKATHRVLCVVPTAAPCGHFKKYSTISSKHDSLSTDFGLYHQITVANSAVNLLSFTWCRWCHSTDLIGLMMVAKLHERRFLWKVYHQLRFTQVYVLITANDRCSNPTTFFFFRKCKVVCQYVFVVVVLSYKLP